MITNIVKMIGGAIISQPQDNILVEGRTGCSVSEYIEERNGVVVRRVFISGNCRYPLFSDGRFGVKVKDGLFVEEHMQNDGRTDLAKRYIAHKRALLLAIEHSGSLPADIDATVIAFNKFWEEQTTSLAVLDPSELEKRLTTLLANTFPDICEGYKKSVPADIENAVEAARNGGIGRKGVNSYLELAREGGIGVKGLDSYLDLAKEGGIGVKGLDLYLDLAKEGGIGVKGLDLYLDLAKEGGIGVKGLDQLVDGAAAEDAAVLNGAYDLFKDKMNAAHGKFVSDMKKAYDGFVTGARRSHGDFVSSANSAHDGFVKISSGLLDTFVSEARALKEPYLKKLDEACASQTGGDMNGLLARIDKMNEIISGLNTELKGKREPMLDKAASAYGAFTAALSDSYQNLTRKLSSGYSDLQGNYRNSYNVLTDTFSAEYQKLQDVYSRFYGRGHRRGFGW
jgi:hypothetical protein